MPICRTILALVLLSFFPAFAFAAERAPIGFEAVNAQVYRGGRPATIGSMSWVARRGIRTVVNLQGDGWQFLPGEKAAQIAEGRAMAEHLGMRYFHFPLPPGGALDGAGVRMLLDVVRVMSDRRFAPVYVHCNVGADRTGLAVAAYRIVHDGCSFDQANQELRQHGAVWTPILMGKEIAFLRDLAEDPRKYGAGPPMARCTLP